MAQGSIGSLRVNLGLDSATFTKGLKKSASELQKFGAKTAKVGAAISVAGAGIIAGVKMNLNAVDELGKTGMKIGVPIEELGRLKHAAEMSGVSFSDLQNSMRRLSRNMVDSEDDFEAMGIAVRDSSGELRQSSDVLDDFADVLAGMPDGAEKTALAFDTLGRSGTQLIPMLNDGAAGLKEMKDEADSLGIVFSQETFDNAVQFNDDLARLGKQMQGIGVIITAQLAPTLATLSEWVVKVASKFRDLSPTTQKWIGRIAGLTVVLGPLVSGLGIFMMTLGPVVAAIAAISAPVWLAVGAFAALAAGAVYLYTKWDDLVESFPALGTALDYVVPILTDLADIFKDIGRNIIDTAVKGFKMMGAILRGDFSAAAEYASDIVGNIGDHLLSLADLATTAIDGLTGGMATGMINLANKAWKWGFDVVMKIVEALENLYEIGVAAIKDLAKGIRDEFVRLKDAALGWGRDVAQGISDGISGGVSKVKGAVTDLSTSAKDAITGFWQTKSPSKVTFDIGQDITQGLADGIESGDANVSSVLGNLGDGFEQVAQTASESFKNIIKGTASLKDALVDVLSVLADVIMKSAFAGIGIPGFATGTPHAPGGVALVGERGPELVNLPRGSRVLNASQTRGAMGGGGDVNMTFAPVIDARGADVGAVQRMEAALAQANAEFDSRAINAVNIGKKRRLII